jgi:branched-chain amino acid aminotransferase
VDLTLEDVYGADEMFCTGTMGELAAVTSVDGKTIGNGQVGAMTRRLTELYAERTAREGVAVVD